MSIIIKPRALLLRQETGDTGTFGSLKTTTGFTCFTAELPWRDNKPMISCIPEGEYEVFFAYSRHFSRMLYRLKEVPGRAGCLVHSGNYAGDKAMGYRAHSNGCILLGRYLGTLDGQKAVLSSMPTLLLFNEAMKRKPFILEIKNGY